MEKILILGIGVALLFNFLNGLHDAANSISTIVATRVLTPLKAIILASFFNLIGPLFFTTAIAKTIGAGIIAPGWLTVDGIIVGILIASFWIYLTAYIGIPISSTHAMIGGLIGTAVAIGGIEAVILPSVNTIIKLVIFGAGGAIAGGISLSLIAVYKKDGRITASMPPIATAVPISPPIIAWAVSYTHLRRRRCCHSAMKARST